MEFTITAEERRLVDHSQAVVDDRSGLRVRELNHRDICRRRDREAERLYLVRLGWIGGSYSYPVGCPQPEESRGCEFDLRSAILATTLAVDGVSFGVGYRQH